jgi:hypothetical protein
MAEGKPFLPETETAVPIICQPSEGKVVGGRDGRGTAGHPPYLPQRRAGRGAIPADLHPG